MLTHLIVTNVFAAPVPPVEKPFAMTLAGAKQFLRYEGADASQDETLNMLLRAGQQWVERYTGLLLTRRQVRQPERSLHGAMPLLWGPVADEPVTVDYFDGTTGATFSTVRVVPIDSEGRARLYPVGAWPATSDAVLTYSAGYADPDDVPDGLLHAMLVYASMSDDDREGGSNGDRWNTLNALIAPYRVVTV